MDYANVQIEDLQVYELLEGIAELDFFHLFVRFIKVISFRIFFTLPTLVLHSIVHENRQLFCVESAGKFCLLRDLLVLGITSQINKTNPTEGKCNYSI